MANAILQGETGRNVDGKWQTKPVTLYMHSGSGWLTISKSDGVSAATILEVRLSDLLRALGECV